MELVFDTRTSRGKVTKNARVTSNDVTKLSFSIDFTAQIIPDPDTISKLRYSPTTLEFTGESRKQTIVVENHDLSDAKLGLVGSSIEDISAKIKDDDLKPGKSTKLEFQWNGDNIPEYNEENVFTVETGLKSVQRFSIPFIIKGEKGSKPATAEKHAEVQKTTAQQSNNATPITTKNTAKMTSQQKGDQKKEGEIYRQYNPDSASVDKPLPGTHQWPPK